MYKRKIEAFLQNWKNTPDRKPLVIKGVRQCGKTSSVVDFANKNYKNVVYLDFFKQESLKEVFDGSLDTDYLTLMISAVLPGVRFEPGRTCLILDEIQNCPRARSSLKFFKLDGRYDVICTGSLLGVNGYKSDAMQKLEEAAPVPVGFETIVDMYPMDFEEWLWANGMPDSATALLRNHFTAETPVPEPLHNRMRELMLQYVVVGGMPEAVRTFFATHDMNRVIAVQRGIVEEYKADMVKYARAGDKPRIRECFDSIPRQLSKENKKFMYSSVRKGGRSGDYVASLQWIEDAGIVRRCHNLSIPELPLGGNAVQDCFKIYMADTGLFASMLDDGAQSDILRGSLYGYKGAVFENALADVFGKMGRNLYYYRKSESMEIDFVIRHKGEAVPVECKATTGNAKSLKSLLKHPEKYHLQHAFKFGDYNVGRSGQILTLPLYMAFLLNEL